MNIMLICHYGSNRQISSEVSMPNRSYRDGTLVKGQGAQKNNTQWAGGGV